MKRDEHLVVPAQLFVQLERPTRQLTVPLGRSRDGVAEEGQPTTAVVSHYEPRHGHRRHHAVHDEVPELRGELLRFAAGHRGGDLGRQTQRQPWDRQPQHAQSKRLVEHHESALLGSLILREVHGELNERERPDGSARDEPMERLKRRGVLLLERGRSLGDRPGGGGEAPRRSGVGGKRRRSLGDGGYGSAGSGSRRRGVHGRCHGRNGAA